MVIDTKTVFGQLLKLLETARKTTQRYIDLIKTQLERSDPELYSFVMKAFESYPSAASAIIGFGKVGNASQLVELFDIIYPLSDGVASMRDLLDSETYYKSVTSKMSSSFDVDVNDIRGAASKAWQQYEDYMSEKSDAIFAEVAAGISAGDIGGLIASRSRVAISLLKIVAPNAPAASKVKIRSFIERQKDEVLGASRLPAAMNILAPVQSIPFRFGLTPLTNFNNITNLAKIIHPSFVYDATATRAANLKSIAAAMGVGIAIAHNEFGTKMEFDIRGLVDEAYITENNLKVSILDGLTKAAIKRFSTIIPLPVRREQRDQQLSTSSFGDQAVVGGARLLYSRNIPNGATELIYFETFDGFNFRVMGRAGTGKYTIDVSEVPGLIYGATTRPTNYNAMMSDVIFQKCITKTTEPVVSRFENIEPGLSSMEGSTAGMTRDTTVIREKIRDALLELVDFRSVKPGDMRGIRKAFRRPLKNLEQILMKVLAPGLSSEETTTYMFKIVDLVAVLNKEMIAAFMESDFSEAQLGHVKSDEMPARIREIFAETYSRALNTMNEKCMWSLYDASLKELYITSTNIY